jgi:hypothetical protein
MSDLDSNRVRQIIGWGIIGLIAVIGVSIALSLYFVPAGRGAFFPFHFGWLGAIVLIFIVFWIAKWFFWPWRGDYSYRYQHMTAESILRKVRQRRNHKRTIRANDARLGA